MTVFLFFGHILWKLEQKKKHKNLHSVWGLPALFAAHWTFHRCVSWKCAQLRTHISACCGPAHPDNAAMPPTHSCPLKKNPSCHTSNGRDRYVAAGQNRPYLRLCVCACVCPHVCAWGSAGLVIFHWSPSLWLTNMRLYWNRLSLGANHLGLGLFMAQEEPLNLKGFWMENSVLVRFLVSTLLHVWGPRV